MPTPKRKVIGHIAYHRGEMTVTVNRRRVVRPAININCPIYEGETFDGVWRRELARQEQQGASPAPAKSSTRSNKL